MDFKKKINFFEKNKFFCELIEKNNEGLEIIRGLIIFVLDILMNYNTNFFNLNNEKNDFINLCNVVMNSSTIYDRKIFKAKRIKFIIIMIAKWKNSSVNFTKLTCLKPISIIITI